MCAYSVPTRTYSARLGVTQSILIKEDGLELLSRALLHRRQHMRVGVERQRDARVAKPLAHDLRILTCEQEQREAVMSMTGGRT